MIIRWTPAPWFKPEGPSPFDDLVSILDGSWREAAVEFYADRVHALNHGKRSPMGIQKYLNRTLEARFQAADWYAYKSRFIDDERWIRITFRHQMSLGTDVLDAIRVHRLEGTKVLAIAAAPERFLRVITPNDAAALCSFEKLHSMCATMVGALDDIPLWLGEIRPVSELPGEAERVIRSQRKRGGAEFQ